MYDWMTELCKIGPEVSVLDVGVTCDSRSDSNFFEQLYPHPERLTAVGLEDASFLEKQYPGLKFVLADGKNLPFANDSFDLVVSFAVIEHVGSRSEQKALVDELCRVGKFVCITTPNRGYPLEFHTMMPLIHWLPPQLFRRLLRLLGKNFFAEEANLNLLDETSLRSLLPKGATVTWRRYRLLGMVSNLFAFIDCRSISNG